MTENSHKNTHTPRKFFLLNLFCALPAQCVAGRQNIPGDKRVCNNALKGESLLFSDSRRGIFFYISISAFTAILCRTAGFQYRDELVGLCSNRGPSAYQPSPLPLSQTGSESETSFISDAGQTTHYKQRLLSF